VRKEFEGKVTEFVWDGDDLVHERVSDAATGKLQPLVTWVFEPGTFAPVAKFEGKKRYSVVTDALGTPTMLMTEAGKLAWKAQLDLYGAPREERAGIREADRATNPLRYAGQYHDEETGLSYNRFRYYDPETGRYISQDPIRLRGGSALYGYVTDPLRWGDPFGLGPCKLQTRTPEEVAALRREFEKSGGAREQFLKALAQEEGSLEMYGEEAVESMKNGEVPEDLVVHHKKPLFRGGTNDFENLEMMDWLEHLEHGDALHYYPEGKNPYGLN
jgi:RHS repeat-associated protein